MSVRRILVMMRKSLDPRNPYIIFIYHAILLL